MLESITLDGGGENLKKKKRKIYFTNDEDTHLCSSWLNVSTNPIIDDGQARDLVLVENHKSYKQL